MTLMVAPGYSDFFSGEKPRIEDLLLGIPSRLVILFCAGINSELYNKEHNLEKQLEILSIITAPLDPLLGTQLHNQLLRFKKSDKTLVVLFAKRFCQEFIHRELLHFRDEMNFEGINVELNIFKAYLLVVEELTDADEVSHRLDVQKDEERKS